MLNRFWKAKADEGKAPVTKRPHLASECQDLAEAERWRGQIIREIGRKVAEVQNGAWRVSALIRLVESRPGGEYLTAFDF